MPYIRHSNPWDLHGKDKVPKISGFGRQWDLHFRTWGTAGIRESPFEGLMGSLLLWDPAQRQQLEKCPDFM